MNWTLFIAELLSSAESSMPSMNEILEMLENSQGLIEGIGALLLAIISLISIIGTAVASILGIASTAFTLIFTIGVFIVGVVWTLLNYLGCAIPLFVIGRKVKCKFAWLAWIPFFQGIFGTIVLWKISGKDTFEIFNEKIKVKQGLLVVLAYVLVYFFGPTIVTFLIGVLNLVPAIGQVAGLIASLLYILPAFVMGVIEYVYLRDTIRLFKSDDKKCQVHAFVVVILDSLLTFGWARNFYLISMMKMKPLPENEAVMQDVPVLELIDAAQPDEVEEDVQTMETV